MKKFFILTLSGVTLLMIEPGYGGKETRAERDGDSIAASSHFTVRPTHRQKSDITSETLDQMKRAAKDLPLTSVGLLLSRWQGKDGTTRASLRAFLQEEIKNFTPFTPSHLEKTLREGTAGENEEQSFETYLKYLNLLHGLGQPRVQETNMKIWIALHHVLEEAIGERGDLAALDNPDLYRRCLRLMACLYPPAREDLAHRYRTGEKAFPKDPEAASKFSTPLNLPLSLVAR